MLDNNSKTVINTPASGIIQRSNEKSFFVRMHQKSQLSDKLFTDNPKYNDKPVMVIQVLLIQENYLLVELVNSDDF